MIEWLLGPAPTWAIALVVSLLAMAVSVAFGLFLGSLMGASKVEHPLSRGTV